MTPRPRKASSQAGSQPLLDTVNLEGLVGRAVAGAGGTVGDGLLDGRVGDYRRSAGCDLAEHTPTSSFQTEDAEQEQHHDRAQDRANDADGVKLMGRYPVVLDQVPDETADERARDAQQDRAQEPDAIPARDEQPGQQPGDKPNNDQNNNECNHDTLATVFAADHAALAQCGAHPAGVPCAVPVSGWAGRT